MRSAFPPKVQRLNRCQFCSLLVLNGILMRTYGQGSRTLDSDFRCNFRRVFLAADFQNAILFIDHPHHFHLSADIRDWPLVDHVTKLSPSVVLVKSASVSPTCYNSTGPQLFGDVLDLLHQVH